MWRKKKTPMILFVFLFFLCILAGYYFSGIFKDPGYSLMNLEERLGEILENPFSWYWNEKTPACILAFLLGWLYFVSSYLYRNRNFQFGQEYGSAQWADPELVTKQLADPVLENNRLLSRHVQISKKGLSNNNTIVIGSPGTGKSTGIVIPNLLTASASYVVLDVKGELLDGYGNYLKEKGYRIKALNLKIMERSNQYNPFSYIRTEEDIIKLVTNLQVNTTPPDSMKGDPFWEDGLALYLMSLFYYVWMECTEEERTMNKVLELCNKEAEVLDEDGTTALGVMMERLTYGKMGKNHPAYLKYQKLKGGHPETVKSIILMVNAKLKFFETPGIRRIFSSDDMELEGLGTGKNRDGETKMALFLVLPDNDQSFNFVTGMLYTQIFDTLIRTADLEYHGALPIPVEIWMDEFANGARPDRFENLITTLRSRNISAVLFLQSVDQIETIYKGETWGILMDACSTFVFLGAGRGALATQEYISKLLGQATIDKRSEGESRGGKNGSSSLNFDRAARELLSAAEIGRLPREKCIILLEGHQPILDDKIRPFKEKTFLYAKSLGRFENPVIVRKKPDGEYETIKASGMLQPLSEKSVAYFKQKVQEGKAVIFELDDASFLQMDFRKEGFRLEDELRQAGKDSRKGQEDHQEIRGRIQERKSILKLLKETEMSDEQFSEIIGGLEDGLTEEQILEYFYMEPEKMRQMRRYFKKKNENR